MVVIRAQPPTATTTVVQRPTGDHYMTLSIVLTVICLMCGGWWSLLCTIPAIIFALAVSTYMNGMHACILSVCVCVGVGVGGGAAGSGA